MTVAWPDGWYPESAKKVPHAWEQELQLEVSPKHILWQQQVRLVARRHDRDEALFELDDGRVAEVHLTWRQAEEPDGKWPWTVVFSNLDQWHASKKKESEENT